MQRRVLTMVLLAGLILPAVATAQAQVVWVREYDPALWEFPEGIAVDLQGNIYVAMAVLGQVRKISPDGIETILFQFPTGSLVVGLAVDAPGNVYAGVVAPPEEPSIHGIWKIDHHGLGTHLPGSEAIGMPPNGLAIDPRGNLWVTDSWVPGTMPPDAEGSIWRIPPGGEAELWYRDSLYLGGLGLLQGYAPIGANGIAYYHRALYVANTERGHIVRIPVRPSGQPGEPQVLITHPDLALVDGITMDVLGTIFAAIIGQNKIIAISTRTGTVVELAAGDPLDGPASLTFGAGNDRVDTLFFTNYAVLSQEPNPGVLKLELDWPPGWWPWRLPRQMIGS
jgi:sugar lactone lactonase YvrE